MPDDVRPLAVVIGASSGIGYEWAKCCARNNYDLILCAGDPSVKDTAARLKSFPIQIDALETDLGKQEEADRLLQAIKKRPVSAVLIHAGSDSGIPFAEAKFETWRKAVDSKITGMLYFVQHVVRRMIPEKSGLILFAGVHTPQALGKAQAVDSGIKSFLNSFALGLRQELKDSGVKVSILLPGETGTQFVESAGVFCTPDEGFKKQDPSNIARIAFKEMLKSGSDFVSGWQNMMQTALSSFSPELSTAFRKAGRNIPIMEGTEQTTPNQRRETMPGYSRSQSSRGGSRDEYEDRRTRRSREAEERPRDEEGRFMSEEESDYRSRGKRSGWEEDDRPRRRSTAGRRGFDPDHPRDEEGRFTSREESDESGGSFPRGRRSREEEDREVHKSRSKGGSRDNYGRFVSHEEAGDEESSEPSSRRREQSRGRGYDEDEDEERSYRRGSRHGSRFSSRDNDDDDEDDDD